MKKEFRNWAGTFSCLPAKYFQPSTEDEIRDLLILALKEGKTVRLVGSGHSPSDIACTSGFMVNLDKFDKLLQVDKNEKQVHVQAGMRLSQLHKHLDANSLAVSNLGSISEQSIAGAISTGTHGTGIDFGILSSMVVELRLMTHSGQILTCNKSRNSDIFKAALCSLNALGIILSLKLQVEDAFNLEAVTSILTFNEMISRWEELAKAAEHVRFWWIPHTDSVVYWRANRTSKSVPRNESNWMRDRFFGYHVLEAALFASKFIPCIVPLINDTWSKYNFEYRDNEKTIGKSNEIFNFDCLFKQYVTEWCVEWKTAGPKAMIQLRDFIHSQKSSYAHFPIEIRFVKGDDIWLSPAYGQEAVCYIGIIGYRPYGFDVQDLTIYWATYEKIMIDLDGRPHWAKQHPLQVRHLGKIYPKFEEFCKLRQQLDPGGMFINDYIRRHFIYKSAL